AADAFPVLFARSFAGSISRKSTHLSGPDYWPRFFVSASAGRVDLPGHRRCRGGVDINLLSLPLSIAAGVFACGAGHGLLLRHLRPRSCPGMAIGGAGNPALNGPSEYVARCITVSLEQ